MTNVPTTAAGLLLSACLLFSSAAAAPAARPTAVPVLLTATERVVYTAAFEQHVALTYARAGLTSAGLPVEVFRQALVGLYNLRQQGSVGRQNQVISIIDFSRASKQKRLWIVDVAQGRLLHHSLVAHGKNSGEQYALNFSNQEGSEMSSLGFYVTGNTYQGKHGLSLKLHGVDAGYNTNALSRAVVVHGADYVSEQFVQQHGRLGRSQGCPALPVAQAPAIIRTIKGGTVLFIHGPSRSAYRSSWLGLDPALVAFAQEKGLLSHAG